MSKPRRSTLKGSPTQRGGYMTPRQFQICASHALGGRGWKGRLAQLTDTRAGSISRYLNGQSPIPKWMAVIAVTLRHVPKEELETLISAVPIPAGDVIADDAHEVCDDATVTDDGEKNP